MKLRFVQSGIITVPFRKPAVSIGVKAPVHSTDIIVEILTKKMDVIIIPVGRLQFIAGVDSAVHKPRVFKETGDLMKRILVAKFMSRQTVNIWMRHSPLETIWTMI